MIDTRPKGSAYERCRLAAALVVVWAEGNVPQGGRVNCGPHGSVATGCATFYGVGHTPSLDFGYLAHYPAGARWRGSVAHSASCLDIGNATLGDFCGAPGEVVRETTIPTHYVGTPYLGSALQYCLNDREWGLREPS